MNDYLVLETWLLSSSSRRKNVEYESVATAQHYLASPPASPILWMEQYNMFRKMCHCNTDIAMI